MTFTVCYRDAGGVRRTEVFEAASRGELFSQLKRNGIAPLSVKSGGKLAKSSGTAHSLPKGVLYGIIGGIVVVVTAVAVFFLLRPTTPSVPNGPKGRPGRPSNGSVTSSPSAAAASPSQIHAGNTNAVASRKTSNFNIRPSAPLNPDPEYVREDIPAPTPLDKMTPPPPEKVFKTGSEQLLAMATPAMPGMAVPPLPQIDDDGMKEDLEKAMNTALKPSTNDTEETIGRKITVTDQKEEFRELRKKGWTFTEYVKALHAKASEEAEYLKEAHKLNDDLYHDKNVTDEEYKKYREKINSELKERGLPELD